MGSKNTQPAAQMRMVLGLGGTRFLLSTLFNFLITLIFKIKCPCKENSGDVFLTELPSHISKARVGEMNTETGADLMLVGAGGDDAADPLKDVNHWGCSALCCKRPIQRDWEENKTKFTFLLF